MEIDKILNEESLPDGEKNTDDTENEGITSSSQDLHKKKKLPLILHILLFIVISIIFTISLFIFLFYGVPVLQEIPSVQKTEVSNLHELKQSTTYKKQISQMTKDIQRLSRKYNGYTSGQSYIVINTTDNRFYLYTNKKLIREGFCSTGSLTMLRTEKGDQVWVFKTPKGKRWIQGKTTNPYWKRPDWSFIEEGSPVPPKDDPSRWENGVLGDYAMSIGDGYLIHGTIYKRFLGMPVTHGCVRLNDEDLKVIFNTLSIGSKVYIF